MSGRQVGYMKERSPGSWWLKVATGINPKTGKPQYRTKTVQCRNKSEAQRELARFVAEIEEGRAPQVGQRLTVGQYLDRWLAGHALNISTRTLQGYERLVRDYIKPQLGRVSLVKLTPLDIKAAYKALVEGGGKDGRSLSAQTVKHVHRCLFSALDAAVREERAITFNPARAVKPPRVARKEVQVLGDVEAVGRLLRAADGHRYYVPIFIALSTGLRRGELMAIRWRDIDWNRSLLRIEQAFEAIKVDPEPGSRQAAMSQRRTVYRLKEPKTAKGRRSVHLPVVALELLRQHQAQQRAETLETGARSADGLVFFDHFNGEAISLNAISQAFHDISKAAGLGVTLHGLRHSHITALLAAGVPLKVVSERAGHSSISVTGDIYGHVLAAMDQAAAEAVDGPLRAAIASAVDTECDTEIKRRRSGGAASANRKVIRIR